MNRNEIPTAEYSFSGNEIEAIVDAALASLLWSEGEMHDENGNITGEMWDETYDESDAVPELRAAIKAEVNALDLMSLGDDAAQLICNAAHAYVELCGVEAFGHDMNLTRNGHGAGFWDRGLGELGDVLTDWAESLGTLSVFEGYGDTLGMFHAE